MFVIKNFLRVLKSQMIEFYEKLNVESRKSETNYQVAVS